MLYILVAEPIKWRSRVLALVLQMIGSKIMRTWLMVKDYVNGRHLFTSLHQINNLVCRSLSKQAVRTLCFMPTPHMLKKFVAYLFWINWYLNLKWVKETKKIVWVLMANLLCLPQPNDDFSYLQPNDDFS